MAQEEHTQEITVVESTDQTLSLNRPKEILKFGKVLKKYIEDNGLSLVIAGNNYSMVDGWKFAGANFGLTAMPDEPQPIHKGQYITILYTEKEMTNNNGTKWKKEYPFFAGFSDADEIFTKIKKRKIKITREIVRPYYAYKCNCKIIRISDDKLIGTGSAICSNLEIEKVSFDEYSVFSMAQTRTIGKGYRNLLGYVMKAAGFEGTPAEEMTKDMGDEKKKPEPPKATTGKLMSMNEKQFVETKERVKKGQVTIDKVQKHFDLTEAQLKELQEIKVVKMMTDKEFQTMLLQVSKGKKTIVDLQAEFEITEDQLAALQAVEPK